MRYVVNLLLLILLSFAFLIAALLLGLRLGLDGH